MVKTCVSRKPIEFKLYAPQAKKVSLAGTFNNWSCERNIAKKDLSGNWLVKINLKPGRYEYKFFVDGNWVNDPKALSVPNAFGTNNSVIEV